VVHHGRGLAALLRQAGRPASDIEALVGGLSEGRRPATLSPKESAVLDYALKLTRTPHAVTAADVEALRRHGLDDRAIHDLCVVVAYFAFVNRIADGLGVELEPTGR
jgi:uncharacterized peroxidase-related enzyme